MRRVIHPLVFTATALFAGGLLSEEEVAAPPPEEASSADDTAAALGPAERGDAELRKRTLQGYERAIALYREALQGAPSDAGLKLRLLHALNSYMRRSTGGNIPQADGTTVDTAPNKKVWARFGPEAVALGEELVAQRPRDPEVRLAYLEAFMYHSSSFGIVKAVFTGAADTYRDNANALVELDASYDGAAGLSYLAGFYLVAPWPIGDVKKARAYAERAVKASPQGSVARYYLGMAALKQQDHDVATAAFELAASRPCSPQTVLDYCEALRKEAKRGLELAKR